MSTQGAAAFGSPRTDLRDQIAREIRMAGGMGMTLQQADAVLAIPAIADAVALAELCAPLTIEQVAMALMIAADAVATDSRATDTHDDWAIAAWREPSPLFWEMTPARRAVIDRALAEAPVWEDKR